MLKNEPNFIKANTYYFSIRENTIYGKEYGSFEYWHEYSHYKDHQRKRYRKLSNFISELNQFILLCMTISLITLSVAYFIKPSYMAVSVLQSIIILTIIGLFPIGIFILQEEVRADFFAWRKTRK